MVSRCGSAVAGTHLLRRRREGARWDTWDMEPLSVSQTASHSVLRILVYFSTNGTLGQIFATPLFQVSHCPNSNNILFYL
jgi:hypothetical protein